MYFNSWAASIAKEIYFTIHLNQCMGAIALFRLCALTLQNGGMDGGCKAVSILLEDS